MNTKQSTDEPGTKLLTGESPLPVVVKPSSIERIDKVEILPIIKLLEQLPDRYWKHQDQIKDNNYPVFHSTEHIVLRFIKQKRDPRHYYSNASWQLFAPVLMGLMKSLAHQLEISNPVFPKAMFARLNAGSKIEEHIDHGVSHKYVHKIHVPLISHPDIRFQVGDHIRYLQPGYAYEVNNLLPHSVNNNTDIQRVHFIFEVFDSMN